MRRNLKDPEYIKYINDVGIEWHKVKDVSKEDSSQKYDKKINIWNEIAEIAYGIAGSRMIDEDAVQKFLTSEISRFDPDKKDFFTFLSVRLNLRGKDAKRKRRREELSLNEFREKGDGTAKTVDSNVTDKNMLYYDDGKMKIVEKEERDDIILILISSVLNFSDFYKGKANNPDRKNYYRLFFTDSIQAAIDAQNDDSIFLKHERDIFRAIKKPFLDFFMVDDCTSINDIENSFVKKYGEMVEGKTMDSCPKRPFPADIFMNYMAHNGEKPVGNSTISGQRKNYMEFLKEHINNDESL